MGRSGVPGQRRPVSGDGPKGSGRRWSRQGGCKWIPTHQAAHSDPRRYGRGQSSSKCSRGGVSCACAPTYTPQAAIPSPIIPTPRWAHGNPEVSPTQHTGTQLAPLDADCQRGHETGQGFATVWKVLDRLLDSVYLGCD